MSGDQGHSLRRHFAGLMLASASTGCLVALWIHGPWFLRGTMFEDLFSIVYVGLAAAVLTAAEKIAQRLNGH